MPNSSILKVTVSHLFPSPENYFGQGFSPPNLYDTLSPLDVARVTPLLLVYKFFFLQGKGLMYLG